MITSKVTGTGDVARIIADYCAATGKTMEQEIIATARLVAVSLATSTQPYGSGASARADGEARVSKDISKVFRTPSSIFAEIKEDDPASASKFWSAFKRADVGDMRSIMTAASIDLEISATPRKELHEGARNTRGRVTGRAKQLVTQPGALAAYIKQRQKKVGFAKAGWAAAADDCGGHRGIPAWASGRHRTAPGMAVITRDAVHPRVVIKNNVDYIDQVLPPREIEGAVSIAYQKLIKRIKIITSKTRRISRAA